MWNSRQYILLVLCLLVLLPLSYAISFSANPSIFPTNNITTTTPFFCQFTPTDGSLTANITWYRNGVSWTNDDQNTSVTNGVQFQSNTVDTANTQRSQVWICQVTLNNATASLSTNSSSITIVNALPIVQSIANQTVYEDAAFSLQMNATDPDNDSILWFSIDQNASDYGGVSLFSITSGGLISFTQTDESLVGNHTMRIIADDDLQFSGIKVNFELIAVNDAPVIDSATLSRSCNENELCSFSITATDEEGDDINFTANESFINLGISGTFSFTPNISQVGTHYILINATDGLNWTTGVLNLTINSTNHVPTFTGNSSAISSALQNQSTNFTFYINATDIDSADTLSFSIDSSCTLSNPWSITTLTDGANSTTAQGVVNINLSDNNDYVVCRAVTITVSDGVNDTLASFTFNITNTNDAPIIYEGSYFSDNLQYAQFQNTNMSNVTFAKGLLFSFKVNATDVDNLTYEGESFNYSLSGHDPLLYQINATSGLITSLASAMNDSYVGNTSFYVVVTDDENLSFNRSINITIINNTIPVISSINNTYCIEESLCTKDFVAYDGEGSNLTFSLYIQFTSYDNQSYTYTGSQALSYFNMSFSSYNGTHTNYTMVLYADDEHVGNYSVQINFTDDFGELDSSTFNFSIYPVNDIPYIGDNYSALSTDNLTFSVTAEGLVFEKILYGIDPDVQYTQDNITFNYSYLVGSLTTTLTTINATATRLTITPGLSDAGNYTINLTVVDSTGNFTSQIVNFTVYDSSLAPTITQVRPYTNASNTTIFAFTSSLGANNISTVYINESVLTIFDIVATDTDDMDIYANWYEDGTLVESNLDVSGDASYTRTFSYNESGTFNITVNVIDKGIATYTWLVVLGNVNQVPLFVNNLSDLSAAQGASISGKQIFADFFRLSSPGNIVFIDPDDDINGNDYIDNSENNTLTFHFNTSSSCNAYADFDFSGEQLTITPSAIGNCTASFYATDTYGINISSNGIRVDILDLGESDSGGSGSSGSSSSSSTTRTVTETVTVPLDNDVPSTVKFVFLGISSIYDNGTVIIPIRITNNWDGDISDIDLSFNASIPELVGTISQSFIPNLATDQSYYVNLTFTRYRFDAPIEVNISADIGSLDHIDMATIFINALEKGSYGEEAVQSRIGFARDLLNDNSECAELNEILNNAEGEEDAEESLKLINAVIDGCKYLINTQKAPSNELPKSFIGKIGIYTENYVDYRLLFTLILGMTFLAIGIGVFSRFKLKKI